MAADFKSIPIIDVSPLLEKWDDPNMAQDEGVAQVVFQLDRACREAGCFYVKGHNIPDSLLNEVRVVARQFFHLPLEHKLKINLSPATGYRGYQQIGVNVTKGVLDRHEAVDFYKEVKPGTYGTLGEPLQGSNRWPSHPPNFQKLNEEYINLCTGLSRSIMRGIAVALGASPVELEGEIAGDPFWVLGASNHRIPTCFLFKCGPHTDYGLLSLINQGHDIPALEVRNKSGDWISAPPIPGTLVCNIGDMLKILSNGIYESTLHRVINNSPTYRVCVGYFHETNYEAAVEPLTACVQQTGGTKKFERAVVYGQHLVSKVQKNFIFPEDVNI